MDEFHCLGKGFFAVLVKYSTSSYGEELKGSFNVALVCAWWWVFSFPPSPISLLFLDHYGNRIAGEGMEMSCLCNVCQINHFAYVVLS